MRRRRRRERRGEDPGRRHDMTREREVVWRKEGRGKEAPRAPADDLTEREEERRRRNRRPFFTFMDVETPAGRDGGALEQPRRRVKRTDSPPTRPGKVVERPQARKINHK